MPGIPGLPSCPCRISTTSSAHLCRPSYAVRFRSSLGTDLHRFILDRVSFSRLKARVRVAQPHDVSPGNLWIGSKDGCRHPASVTAAPASITRHAAMADFQTLASSGMVFRPVCVCSWRSALCARGMHIRQTARRAVRGIPSHALPCLQHDAHAPYSSVRKDSVLKRGTSLHAPRSLRSTSLLQAHFLIPISQTALYGGIIIFMESAYVDSESPFDNHLSH